jgi:hypothetical protein
MEQNFVWVKKFLNREIQQDGSNGRCIQEAYGSTLDRTTYNLAAETFSPSGEHRNSIFQQATTTPSQNPLMFTECDDPLISFDDKESQQLIYRYITHGPSVKDGRDEVTGGGGSAVRKN